MSNLNFSNIKNFRLMPFSSKNTNLKSIKIHNGVFYKIEKNGRYFYIGGSIHIGNNKKVTFNDAVKKAYKDSTKLAVELDISNIKNMINLYKELSKINIEKSPVDDETSTPDFSQPETKTKYKTLCKELNLNFEKHSKLSLQQFHSILYQKLMKKAGYNDNYGIDNIFTNKAKHDKKEIISLETPHIHAEALLSLVNMSPETLGNRKIRNFEDLQTSIETLSKMHDAIFEGDTLTLVNDILIYKPMNKSDENNLNKLLFHRNKDMLNKIESLIVSPEIYFVIVGAAHVLGKNGLLKLFKDKGYKISRLK